MKQIRIAVIADNFGFKQFIRDNNTSEDERLPYVIKFIQVDDEMKTRGDYYNSYILHWSGFKIKDYPQIIERIISRIIEIR